MFKCIKKNTLSFIGLGITIFFGCLNIVCIILSLITYEQLEYKWTSKGGWRRLASFQIGTVVSVFIMTILGIVDFTHGRQCKTIQYIYTVLEPIVCVLASAVGIFSLFASAIDKNSLNEQCKSNYKGMFEKFLYLDDLMFLVDKELCSESCPCNFTNTSALNEFNYQLENEGNFKEIIQNSNKGVDNFISCELIYEIQEEFLAIGDNKRKFGDFDIKKFVKFWGKIEEKFDCSGWCSVSYPDENDGDIKIYEIKKYLFSDVNRGFVKNEGCMNKLIKWLQPKVKAFGVIMLVIGLVMIMEFIFAIGLALDLHAEGSNIPDMSWYKKNEISDEKGNIKELKYKSRVKSKSDNSLNN